MCDSVAVCSFQVHSTQTSRYLRQLRRRPAPLSTEYTNLLNPRNNIGIRNVPLPRHGQTHGRGEIGAGRRPDGSLDMGARFPCRRLRSIYLYVALPLGNAVVMGSRRIPSGPRPETFVHEVCLRSRTVLEDPVPDGNVSPLGLRLIESVVLVFALPLAVLGRVRELPASVALHDFLSAVDRAAYSKYVIPV